MYYDISFVDNDIADSEVFIFENDKLACKIAGRGDTNEDKRGVRGKIF